MLAYKFGAKPSIAHVPMLIKRTLENAIWSVGPILYTAALIRTLLYREWLNFSLLTIAGFVHLLCIFYVGQFYRKKFSDVCTHRQPCNILLTQLYISLFIYPFMLLGSCFGPLTYYLLWIWKIATGQAVPRFKTNR